MSPQNLLSKLHGYYQRRAGSLVFRKPFVIGSQQPVISFTFDDFPKSALLSGGALLNRYGLKGTYYASFGLLGSDAPTGQIFSMDDLSSLFEQGHELGCHTFEHCDSWETRTPAFEKSVLHNQLALNRFFPGAEFKTFSYPISEPRPLTKARVGDYFLCCRGGGQTINAGRVDLNQLSAYFLEKKRHDFQSIKDVINQNRQARGWLIFATHDISDNPTPYGCTPKFFEQVVEYAVSSGALILPVIRALEVLDAPGCRRRSNLAYTPALQPARAESLAAPKPLVSILIPAYNAQEWIANTLRSAIAQTWEPKEIIVVDDGSTDQTVAIARQFESDIVRVVTQTNQGAAAARNYAFSLSRGEYVQWLDADDLLAPDKIARQMAVRDQNGSKRTLLSSEFGKFLHQWPRAKFVRTQLWEDLNPADWLLRKMGQNLYMQTATWLVSRELCEAAGNWDTRMLSDDDGEYFCRVLLNSEGTRFVPGSKVYYRGFGFDSLAYVGKSDRKRDALWLSMQLHMGYLRSLEDSPRVREACLNYIQRNLIIFYPDRADIVRQAEEAARELGGRLSIPDLPAKYWWIKLTFGWEVAKNTALRMRKLRWSLQKSVDKAIFQFKNRHGRLAIPHMETAPDSRQNSRVN